MNPLRAGFQVTPAVKLLRPLGQGGMGMVWVAEHTGLKTHVVVKFISQDIEECTDAGQRFTREALAAAAVKSPHVVQIFDHGLTSDGLPYIVMELLEGQDLGQYLERYGPMAPRDVAALVAQVAKALGKAHQVGVVHRDIKPDNIFLCEAEGGELFVKLLDFGIAKLRNVAAAASTTTGKVVGTPYYMSPEQIVGAKDIDVRSDIWSLGVVAFEALTGRRPFEGMTVGAITIAIYGKAPRISTHVRGAAPALDEWFAKACVRDRKARFATAREAAQALLDAVGERTSCPALVPKRHITIAGRGETGPNVPREPRSDVLVTTALSSTSSAERFGRRTPALIVVSVAVVALLGGWALAPYMLRKPAPVDVGRPASPPPSAAAAPPAPSAIAPATAALSASTIASAAASAQDQSAAPAASKPGAATMWTPTAKPIVTARGPTGTGRAKKPSNEDDIK